MNFALVLAGGKGERMHNADVPKQFFEIDGKPLILNPVAAFYSHDMIDKIIIICREEYMSKLKDYLIAHNLFNKKNKISISGVGGSTRQESVFNGLKELSETASPDDIILLHDAARPLVSETIITENIESTIRYGASGTYIPADDTVVKSTDGLFISEMPERTHMYMAQTPQCFRYGIIFRAHQEAAASGLENATDDCRLVLKSGCPIHMVKGDRMNFKITRQEDLEVYKILKQP